MTKEKKFSAQTVRVPVEIEKELGHLLVETGESFQSLALRLVRAELSRSGDELPAQPTAPTAASSGLAAAILQLTEQQREMAAENRKLREAVMALTVTVANRQEQNLFGRAVALYRRTSFKRDFEKLVKDAEAAEKREMQVHQKSEREKAG